uniref:Selenoprotein F n=1 Tax=Stegastes partitus TaxID=144197 RepID=A0A3B5BC86_9TELE
MLKSPAITVAAVEACKLYTGAILEMCGLKLGRFPQVQAFVRSDKPKMFKGLQIKYVRCSDHVLKLLDNNGNIAEELSIKWNMDSILGFLCVFFRVMFNPSFPCLLAFLTDCGSY